MVTSFEELPAWEDRPEPIANGPDEAVVEVLAAGLHPRVRSQANGSHYTSTGELPLVPGVDGVGRAPDGTLRYFILPDTALGSMAERTVVDLRRSVVLPEDSDPVLVAAAMNPAMSSWVALRRRIRFEPGRSVLVLGATGNAGRMAVQVGRRLGASSVVGVGRSPEKLAGLGDLGASATVSTSADDWADHLGEAAGDVDVVLDYLWGAPAAATMKAMVLRRRDDSRPLTWIQIGSVAGPESPILSAALRAIRLDIVGSGQGSVPTRDILTELPQLAAEINAGTFAVDARPVRLRDVAAAWADTAPGRRVVIVP
jgi:NADPH:quinone reductase-like Zn-dependent oxidoreductase